jgi:hypothetical protein
MGTCKLILGSKYLEVARSFAALQPCALRDFCTFEVVMNNGTPKAEYRVYSGFVAASRQENMQFMMSSSGLTKPGRLDRGFPQIN